MQRVSLHYYVIYMHYYVIITKGHIITHYYIFQYPELADVPAVAAEARAGLCGFSIPKPQLFCPFLFPPLPIMEEAARLRS